MINNKKVFIQEISNLIDNKTIILSDNASQYFESIKNNDEKNSNMTENGAKILKCMQEEYNHTNNNFKAKDIGELLFISGRSVSGSMRKLISNGYVEKISTNPVSYGLTELGKEYNFDK